jgi:hypothetical protein
VQTSLALVDILPLDYERNVYGERIVHPNIFNLISIKSNNENIKAQLRRKIIFDKENHIFVYFLASNGDEIPVELEKESLQWKIYFTLTEIGNIKKELFVRFELFLSLDYYQLSIIDDAHEQVFDIHCVAEEIDLFRNSGIEDITRLIIDQSNIIADDVNVIVKGKIKTRDSLFLEGGFVGFRSISAYNSSCIL